ncbi:hypothetical protein EV702DRAFT_1051093 [Suillus placidus]|uniref:Fungal-type protein kinase domain-containing protein n=1 Tax=Suillus placidus TaxID=48579 RepID=A0A9P6ZGL7_9AGAM|nr:hypothetical protein EV702DRAFT_1051093 [Suillus placidus]
MDKFTVNELNRLVIREDEPAASQPLGHMLSHIFQPFTSPLPVLSMLQIPLKNILHHNERTRAKFCENSPDDLVPLYDTDAQLWNWDLPTLAPTTDSESIDPQQPEPDKEDNTQDGGAKKATHEEIVSSFFNALAICLAKAQPKSLATSVTATCTWTAAHAHKPLPGTDWGNIRVSAELTCSAYQPTMQLVKAADAHAYLMLSQQPWRRFALVLSLTNAYRELRVLFYDHAGGVVSPSFNINQKLHIVAHIIAAIHFGSLECIGYDLTISFTKQVCPPHHHTKGYRPIKNLPSRRQLADHAITAPMSEPPDPPCGNSVHVAANESIFPATELKSSASHIGSGTHISNESVVPLPPIVQATAISSAPLLNLTTQAPPEPDSIFSATPHPSQFPYSAQSPEPCGKIHVREKIYTIKRILFASRGLVSRGTVCYLATLDDEEFIIKDHWVQGKEDQVVLNEIEMLRRMSGVPGVPTLVDWWIVERSNGDTDMTSKYRKQPSPRSIAGTSRLHVRLVLTPCARPLHMFRTVKELVKALRDIVIIQRQAVEECQVLHRDCSLNNAMIVDLLGGKSRGFLIDWEFAVRINPDIKYAMGGTGTIPFMSRGLLTQLSDAQKVASGGKKMTHVLKTTSNTMELPVTQVVQSFSDDLESLFFVFIWICIKFCGPHGQVREDLGNSIPDRWNNMDLESCGAFKGNFFASTKEEQCLVDEIHPYFNDLIPLATEWHATLKDNTEKLVSFNDILTLLNSHLDRLPDDEELVSVVKTLKESAAALNKRVEKRVASQFFSAELLKRRKSDDDSDV